MNDYGHQATEKELKILESRIKSVYTEAKSDINKKMKDFNARHAKKQAVMKDKLKKGLITKDEYQSWMKGQVFQGNQWKLKREQIIATLSNANEQALKLANHSKITAFIGNANYMGYSLEHTAGVNFGFNLYDTRTVGKLIKEQPDLLPNKHLDKVKDGAWNRKKITRQVTLGIIEGEGVDDVAKRLGEVCDQDWRAMRTSARTAMTSAQNAGRQARLEEAEKKGIKLHKEWMATFDMHTRDAHRELDGQKVPVNKPFKVDGYEIMYPADPHAEGFLVYNCRCSMVADLDDFPEVYQRYDNIDGKPVSQMTYKEWIKAKTVDKVVQEIDYSKFGGKDKYEIFAKYKNSNDWLDNSNGSEFVDLNDFLNDELNGDKEAFEELFKKANGGIDTTAIDYDEFGGKEIYDIVAKYADYDALDALDDEAFLDWTKFYDYAQTKGKSDKKLFEELKQKQNAASKVQETAKTIDYSEFGGEKAYNVFHKYDSLQDFMLHGSGDESDIVTAVTSDPKKLMNLFKEAHKTDKVEAVKELTEVEKLTQKKFDAYDALEKALSDKDIDAEKIYSNIWKNDVLLKDWESKKDAIEAKKDYFESQIKKAQLAGKTADEEKFTKLLDNLKEFDKNGAEMAQYYQAIADVEKELKLAQYSEKLKGGSMFGDEAYTKERKDAALWAKKKKTADDVLRSPTGEVWRNATEDERLAIYEYTMSYSKFNEPLRGIEYGTSKYKGVGNTDLNAGWQDNGKMLNDMTALIDKSSYAEDIWFQRGVRFDGMDKFFNVDDDLLRHGTQQELEDALLGNVVTEYGFMSCGTAKGKGFSGNILLNVYAPSGTKMIYAEPFSHYGAEMVDYNYPKGWKWDGIQKQKGFGDEFETIFQQGTQFRITKIERANKYDTIYMDIEVVNQLDPQLWRK